jgi:hypothetical protein
MHGEANEANELYPAMHVGEVQLPRPHHGGVFCPKIIIIYIS